MKWMRQNVTTPNRQEMRWVASRVVSRWLRGNVKSDALRSNHVFNSSTQQRQRKKPFTFIRIESRASNKINILPGLELEQRRKAKGTCTFNSFHRFAQSKTKVFAFHVSFLSNKPAFLFLVFVFCSSAASIQTSIQKPSKFNHVRYSIRFLDYHHIHVPFVRMICSVIVGFDRLDKEIRTLNMWLHYLRWPWRQTTTTATTAAAAAAAIKFKPQKYYLQSLHFTQKEGWLQPENIPTFKWKKLKRRLLCASLPQKQVHLARAVRFFTVFLLKYILIMLLLRCYLCIELILVHGSRLKRSPTRSSSLNVCF